MTNPRLNKKELAGRVAARTGMGQREVHKVVNALIEEIQSAVMGGEKVAFTDFGVFQPVKRAPRAARNPQSGEATTVPARTVPVFRVALNFRDRVIAAHDGGQAPAN
jgi:DNA-binding protein HU-beta